jgi:hypothetical protein
MILVMNKAIVKASKVNEAAWCGSKMDMPMMPGMDELFK